MDDLAFGFKKLCRRNRDGSETTQKDRERSLRLISEQLKDMGFRNMLPTSLKPKHVEALVQRWQNENLASGTIKNRMAHLRWWAEKVDRSSAIPADNLKLGIEQRVYVTNVNKAQILDPRLERVEDPRVRLSLELQQAFGMRREESIKFSPAYADRGDHLSLKGSWTKGGKPRDIPIRMPEQRELVDRVRLLVGNGSLIPPEALYIQQRHKYDGEVKRAGMSAMHGLRHGYAQSRYQELTGRLPPAAGGPGVRELNPTDREIDDQVRLLISQELGHERIEITAIYLGR
jgi:site-specific recombinase XerC